MKVLNLYACLGGNRLLWDDCHVTAVENDPYLAEMYQKRFPNDLVIVGDAHEYLLHNYDKFDFIWSSPPCPTHSRARNANVSAENVYPDMTLYQEIILLRAKHRGKWVVENVIPYYEPLIPAQLRGRHLYWANFAIPHNLSDRKMTGKMGKMENETKQYAKFHEVDIDEYKGEQRKDKVVRNMVDYVAGKTIFDVVRGIYKHNNSNQIQMF